MNKTAYNFLLGFLLTCLASTSLQAQIPHLVFHVEMSGFEAIPATNSNAKALLTFLFTPDRKKVDISGMIVGLEGTVTEAKIHLGITGETGPEIMDFTAYINDRHIIGQMDVPPVLLQRLLLNGVYAVIKTTAHPAGEIRGQFVCETDLDYGVVLNNDLIQPPNNSNAIAFGGIHFPLGARDVVYAFVVRGLSSQIISAAIYEGIPSPGQVGGEVADMNQFFGSVFQGLILLDTIDPDFLLKAREGKYYAIFRTVNHPEGEIIGQIFHLGYFASLSPVNGVQQLPPPSPPTPGFGFNHTMVSGGLDSLTTTVFINGIAPTSVKVRIGNPNEVGTELVDLGISATPGYYSKKYPITEAQLTDFAQGRLFINAATAAYPNGEIRGVMKNTLRKAYAFDLCGTQMVPPVNSDALGISVASVDQANCYLNYKLIADGLNGAPIFSYYAEGNFGVNGTPFHSLNNTAPIIAGSHEIMAVLGPIIEAGGSYVQIGTAGHPNGEIRGQVRRGFTCPEVVAVTDLENISKVNVSPVPFQEVLKLDMQSNASFDGRLVMRDILGVVSLTQAIQIVEGEQTIQLQAGHLPPGIYTLSLESNSQDAAVLLKKVVKVD